MNANLLDLTPTQEVWGRFYAALHVEVIRLEKIAAESMTPGQQIDSTALVARSDKPTRRVNSTRLLSGVNMEGEK